MIDTCSLVNIRDVHKDSEIIWKAIFAEIEAGRLKTVRHVSDELERRFPDVFKRIEPFKKTFLIPDVELYSAEVIAEIRDIQTHHPGLINPLRGANSADPFLIAASKFRSAVLVTDEKPNGPKHKYKIPYVCTNRNVGWTSGVLYLKGLGCG